MTYYGYIRVSTETQVKKGYGLPEQIARLREWEAQNKPLSAIFHDEGISGTLPSRTGLNELLNTLDADDKVVVLNTSRLWRNDTVKVLVHHELIKRNADIISIEQPTYTVYVHDPNDFLINSILGILDEYDRLLINRKLSNGRTARARIGKKPCGAAPFGYEWQNREIIINEKSSRTVNFIFETYKSVKSYEKTVLRLNERSISAPRGGQWTRQQVKNIINNDFYIGIITHAGSKTIGTHPHIISESLWQATH